MKSGRSRPRGGALLILLCILAAAAGAALLADAAAGHTRRERDAMTAVALARAHEALLAYAIAVAPDTAAKRPGDLPCPDLNNDGSAELTCVTPDKRLGRLPWKTLDLSDLRDGDGERLWYVLSGRFDRTTVNQCSVSGGPNCLNSDTPGTLTVRDTAGATLHDGSDPASAAVAVVIAPGAPLQRVGEAALQARDCTGDADPSTCQAARICSGPATPLCAPAGFLDRMAAPVLMIAAASGGAEDNASFGDGDAGDGFVHGPIRDAGGSVRLNDRVRTLTRTELMAALERRVARHALRCLQAYASASGSRVPWAAPTSTSFAGVLGDQEGERFGRLPADLSHSAGHPGMPTAWSGDCPIAMDATQHLWWANWKDQVFYAVAAGTAPDAIAPGCGSCLTVDPPSVLADKPFVVLLSGASLPGQVRGPGAAASAYLESGNDDADDTFTQLPEGPGFNDRTVFQ